LEQLLSLTNKNSNTISLMKFYLQTRKFDEIIDYQLILSVIKHVSQIRDGMLNIYLKYLNKLFLRSYSGIFTWIG
jgi:hypothetical protein